VTDVTVDPGADPTTSPEVREYLDRLRAEGRHLPPGRLDEMVDDVRAHVRDAVAAGTAAGLDPALAARNALERLGSAAEIVRAEAEQSGVVTGGPAERPDAMTRIGEPVAIFLLMFGGFVFLLGWPVGVCLLWMSRTWRLREKLLGTFVWPFGYLGILLVGGLVTSVESCVSSGTSVGGGDTMTCTGGPPYPDWVGGLLFVVVLAAPVLVAVALWRRRQAVLDGRAT
jgi:uncharacterized membrane protein